MTLVVMADTHIPKRARDLPAELWAAVDAADVVVHAGDWVDLATYERVSTRSRDFIGVHGNNDGPELRERMPEVARFDRGGIRFALVHETGPATGRETRCDERFPDTDVLLFGHSHIPWDSVTPNGLRLLNPGSPTDRRRQPVCTFLTAVLDDGELRDVTLVPVPRTVAGVSVATVLP
ncbi:YfcE family phosphodiesterase [Cryobacterium tepidiphilum]|uniref:Phosphoesterase n=1 Tax=Cryobacterium tepidiphilum TaxID=2486026 RepID=A0A3M8LQE6_9MICO|nr:YfcE family phosphodiesterase [Cryobacterium tepidiphilum]